MKKIYFLLILFVFGAVVSCDLDRDLNDPNQAKVSDADPNLLMNNIQLSFGDFFNEVTNRTDNLVRMKALSAGFNYGSSVQPTNVDRLWWIAYRRVLNNVLILLPIAEQRNLTTHVAAAKIIKAYVCLTLVDLFNNVPLSEAALGTENFNPKADNGADVYAEAIKLLGEARVQLAKTGADVGGALSRDIFYGGNRAKWNALANTLELKAWVNISLISNRKAEADGKIDQLLTSDLIDTEAENFTYKYGTVTVPSNSRHPLYDQYYGAGSAQAGGYICNYFLYELYKGRGVQDPRWRYYFYRQVGSIAKAFEVDPKSVGCSKGAPPTTYAGLDYFCTFDPGFYGRDHGDGSGTPPDSPVITCAGAYPAGGLLDSNPTSNTTYSKPTVRGDGANGGGIEPIWMAFFTDYLKAEILARRGQDAKGQVVTAVQNSVTQIRSFATSKGLSLTAGLEPSTSSYVSRVLSAYDAATDKMEVVGREFYVSLWGNGIEAYNLYRRTSCPRNIAPLLNKTPDPFYRQLIYPALFVNLNSNAPKENNIKNKVFWDTNPDVLK